VQSRQRCAAAYVLPLQHQQFCNTSRNRRPHPRHARGVYLHASWHLHCHREVANLCFTNAELLAERGRHRYNRRIDLRCLLGDLRFRLAVIASGRGGQSCHENGNSRFCNGHKSGYQCFSPGVNAPSSSRSVRAACLANSASSKSPRTLCSTLCASRTSTMPRSPKR
jgi:hypothetical protein